VFPAQVILLIFVKLLWVFWNKGGNYEGVPFQIGNRFLNS
jgi:hypothetical protein